MQSFRKRRTRTQGMTIIEVMVVLVIMSVIAIGVGINVMSVNTEARVSTTGTRARTIQAAAVAYILQHDDASCPTVAELDAADAFDATTELTDAWGNDYELSCEATTVHVRSAGPDETLQTEDDIVLERRERKS